jgi:hypothetical protein
MENTWLKMKRVVRAVLVLEEPLDAMDTLHHRFRTGVHYSLTDCLGAGTDGRIRDNFAGCSNHLTASADADLCHGIHRVVPPVWALDCSDFRALLRRRTQTHCVSKAGVPCSRW